MPDPARPDLTWLTSSQLDQLARRIDQALADPPPQPTEDPVLVLLETGGQLDAFDQALADQAAHERQLEQRRRRDDALATARRHVTAEQRRRSAVTQRGRGWGVTPSPGASGSAGIAAEGLHAHHLRFSHHGV